MPDPLMIPAALHAAMIEHCRREAPLECCGVLGGSPPLVASIHPMRNLDASETSYNADPRDIIAADVALRERGHRFLAIYHSHPRWQAVPSKTDLRRNNYDDLPQIIVSLLTDPPVVRAWRLGREDYAELPWSIT